MIRIILITLLTLGNYLLTNAQNSCLPSGGYLNYKEFVNKKPSQRLQNYQIKNRLGSITYILKDNSGEKEKKYFAVVQNDSLLIRAKEVEKLLNYNKRVVFANKKIDYILATQYNETEIYLEVINVTRSYKYIGTGIGRYRGMIYNFKTSKFYMFFNREELSSYLKQNNRNDLTKLLPKKNKLEVLEVRKIMSEYLK